MKTIYTLVNHRAIFKQQSDSLKEFANSIGDETISMYISKLGTDILTYYGFKIECRSELSLKRFQDYLDSESISYNLEFKTEI